MIGNEATARLAALGRIFSQTSVEIGLATKAHVHPGKNRAELCGMADAYEFAADKIDSAVDSRMANTVEIIRTQIGQKIYNLTAEIEAEGDERMAYHLAFVQVLSFCYVQAKLALGDAAF